MLHFVVPLTELVTVFIFNILVRKFLTKPKHFLNSYKIACTINDKRD